MKIEAKKAEVMVMEVIREQPRLELYMVDLVDFARRLQKLKEKLRKTEKHYKRQEILKDINDLPQCYLSGRPEKEIMPLEDGIKMVLNKMEEDLLKRERV